MGVQQLNQEKLGRLDRFLSLAHRAAELISRSLPFVTRLLDAFALITGRAVSWLSLALVLVTMLIVVLRYVFDIGSIALQEVQMYLHGGLFMLGLAYTLACDEHVRVDIFYQRLSPARRALVNLLGTLLCLLPTCVLVLVLSWDYVDSSWEIREGSSSPGGLPLVFVLKSLLLVAPALLVLQGIAETLRAWQRWRHPDDKDGARIADADHAPGEGV
ncbi:MAG: TRAP transporter small permease subunit [Alcanivoracaceae bacterium]|nr:TRAP transporter small permease subunit [Alcanivoracaceae bacterium]